MSEFTGSRSVEEIQRVEGTGIPVRGDDIDTDQIIPARFLKVVTFDGIGQFAFFDQRFDEQDNPKDHPFNDERYHGASVLVVNANFGCGSSREHAPQALMRWGIDAIIGESFAEIFAGNCKSLGIPAVTADPETVSALQQWVSTHPDEEITIDIANQRAAYGDETVEIRIDDAQRNSLVEGTWDRVVHLGSNPDEVRETAASLPYLDLEPDAD